MTEKHTNIFYVPNQHQHSIPKKVIFLMFFIFKKGLIQQN